MASNDQNDYCRIRLFVSMTGQIGIIIWHIVGSITRAIKIKDVDHLTRILDIPSVGKMIAWSLLSKLAIELERTLTSDHLYKPHKASLETSLKSFRKFAKQWDLLNPRNPWIHEI